ncbi:hypothetical protein FRB99_006746, partial [Tulasnella sp. 403]
ILSIASKWAVDIKRRRNRTTPIYRLPNEILLTIFRLCVPSSDFELPDNETLAELGCDPMTTDYYLLVYTRSVDRQELTDLILERSRTSLLWLEYNATRSKLAKYIKAVYRESCRWRTLVLRLGDPPYILSPNSEELGAAMFPKLSHLLILSHKGAFARLPYFFKYGKPPLNHLQVGGVELDWDQWPSYPELEVLRLCNDENEGLNIRDEHFVFAYDAGAYEIEFCDGPKGVLRIDQLVQSLDPALRSQPMGLDLQLEPTLGGLVHKPDDHLSNVLDLAILEPGAFVLDDLCASPDAPITEWVFPKTTRLYLQLRYRDGPSWDVTQVYPAMVPTLRKLAKARSARAGNSSVEVMALETFELRGKGKVQKRDIEQLKAEIPEVRAGYGMEIVE